jgi:AcrR family transcriptional regulator
MPPAAAPPVERRSASRERILATANRLFYEEGIQQVGIQRIVQEAATTRVTLYRHFPSKDDLVAAYLELRTQYDKDQVGAIIEAYGDDPYAALTELATVLTRDDFASLKRGCPFINASAEFAVGHPARQYGTHIRAWVTERLEELLVQTGHRTPTATAYQLMMVRTGAVVSGALDQDDQLTKHFLECWQHLIDVGLPPPERPARRRRHREPATERPPRAGRPSGR